MLKFQRSMYQRVLPAVCGARDLRRSHHQCAARFTAPYVPGTPLRYSLYTAMAQRTSPSSGTELLKRSYSEPALNADSLSKRATNIGVVGAGQMGAGIAQVAAQSGYSVVLLDVSQSSLDKGISMVDKSLARVAKKKFKDDKNAANTWVTTVTQRISTTTSLQQLASAGLIIEAVAENLKLKKSLFAKLDEVATPETIFASNTSSLPIAAIASATKRQDRFCGLHFFNPVPQMKLVEIVRTDATDTTVIQTVKHVIEQMQKTPVMCKDTPGFIVNRLLVPYLMEAIRLYERGDASLEDIDKAMVLGAGYPMGPFELADYVGLDTCKYITDGWYHAGVGLKLSPLVAPIKMLSLLVDHQCFGKKSGKGFYIYNNKGERIRTNPLLSSAY